MAEPPPRTIPRGFVPWRLSDAGHRAPGSVVHRRHPKPCTKADSCGAAKSITRSLEPKGYQLAWWNRWDDTRYAASHILRSYLRSIPMHKRWNSD